MATSNVNDVIVSKLKQRFSDDLTTRAGDDFGSLWSLWSQEERSVPYLAGDLLSTEYGGSGSFQANEAAYWAAYSPGTTGTGKFSLVDVVNTLDNTVTLGRSPDGGYTFTGTGAGAGNDRRIYYLDSSSITNGEVRLTTDNATNGSNSAGQIGIALRGADNGPAVVFWQNILFGATGQMPNGIWQYNGTTLQSTNQLANTTSLWGPDIISMTGSGTLALARTRGPHGLRGGHIITVSGAGGFNAGYTVHDCPTADSFRVWSTFSGTVSAGNFTWTFAPSPRTMAVRVNGSTMTSKCWLTTLPEPSWSDSLRVATNTIPGTLAVGGVAAPATGLVGIVVAHLGNGASVTARDLIIS